MNIEQAKIVVRFDLAHRGMSVHEEQVLPMLLKEHLHAALIKICDSRRYWYDHLVVEVHKKDVKND